MGLAVEMNERAFEAQVGCVPRSLSEGVVMVGPRKGTREKAFARRLTKALDDHARCPEEYGRGAWLKRELTHFNVNVSDETISKWLRGATMPRRDKMAALAKLLRVDETWLAMGSAATDRTEIEALNSALHEIAGLTDDPKILAIIDRVGKPN